MILISSKTKIRYYCIIIKITLFNNIIWKVTLSMKCMEIGIRSHSYRNQHIHRPMAREIFLLCTINMLSDTIVRAAAQSTYHNPVYHIPISSRVFYRPIDPYAIKRGTKQGHEWCFKKGNGPCSSMNNSAVDLHDSVETSDSISTSVLSLPDRRRV